ncbi:carboxymuconolactone decarboxylase family protein [Sphingopyxis macrogoltabida]|uniref:Carboxymuconolactone decarboxylase n=1 Tax=Sphingopyxis macrogoltabida TaxID=33050 RepID=A0AAC9AZH8_SPHMC|nr:carboxymuconolactone decarboxylase family protein [Sphingopyxis macrogoltabida]ALJ16476.1 carboxymuconolactone decarboxylase [Sphingopyxis macrogoltabida]AMU92710.1 carboxymuconolactone decarboxylase [Sphingopyxis macrogoltabida]
MARLSALEQPYPADAAEAFERIMGKGKEPLLLFRTLAASPRAWGKFRGGALLDGRLLSLREREIVIDRTCARAGCEYEWGVHVAIFAQKAGLTQEDIRDLLEVPAELSRWNAREAALIGAVDALHETSTLGDAEYAALSAHFDRDQILEIIMLAGFYRTVSYLANGLALELEPGAARFADHIGK